MEGPKPVKANSHTLADAYYFHENVLQFICLHVNISFWDLKMNNA